MRRVDSVHHGFILGSIFSVVGFVVLGSSISVQPRILQGISAGGIGGTW